MIKPAQFCVYVPPEQENQVGPVPHLQCNWCATAAATVMMLMCQAVNHQRGIPRDRRVGRAHRPRTRGRSSV